MVGVDEQDNAFLLLWKERHIGSKVGGAAVMPGDLRLAPKKHTHQQGIEVRDQSPKLLLFAEAA